MKIEAVLRGILAIRGWSQERLADELDTTQATISRWLDGREPRGIKMDAIRDLAIESGVIEDRARETKVVPIMGRIGAGAEIFPEFEQVPPDGLEQVDLPFDVPEDIVGFRVDGDSMRPRYDSGDIVLVHSEQIEPTSALIGREAAVRTKEGRRYLKIIARGSRPHTFNLESFNSSTIESARVVWASPIRIVIKSEQFRRIGKTRT